MQNPLFIHLSDFPRSLCIGEKLFGALNYRSWNYSMDLALFTKHKFGFVLGTIPKSPKDAVKAEE